MYLFCTTTGEREDESLVGGRTVTQGQYPFFVYFDGVITCGGVLITLRDILVSAHCFYINRYVAPLNRIKAIVGVVRLDDTTGQEIGVRAFRQHYKFTYTGKGKTLVSDYDMAVVTLIYSFEESSMMKTAPYATFTVDSLRSSFLGIVESNKKCVTIGYGTSAGKRIENLMVLNLEVLPQEGCNIATKVKGSVICCKAESDAIQFGHSGSPLICGGTVFGLFKVFYNYTLDGKEIVAHTYTAVWPFLEYLEVQLYKEITGSAMKISPVFICPLLAIAFLGFMN